MHEVTFLERDVPWYAENRDEPQPAGAVTILYNSLDELVSRHEQLIAGANLVIVGSFVPEGIAVGAWVTSVAKGVTAFYDIDTPVTFANLKAGECEYLTPQLIRAYGVYLSFTGGPMLGMIERQYGSPMARALYCSVDTELYKPMPATHRWDLGYLGTWSADRQPSLDKLLIQPAAHRPECRFVVAGPQYPGFIVWPPNVEREIHLSPREHAEFYAGQKFTLNITRDAMKSAGYSPSVRLFEAGACGVPIISDWWQGLDTVFVPGREILLASTPDDTLRYLRDMTQTERTNIGMAARKRVLAEHTPAMRAAQLRRYVQEAGLRPRSQQSRAVRV